ncbi:acyl-CoA thioesterase [Streptomyces sp. NBC_01431]|uniref:acyl-CoA thioesterase n=1 Tax=Streptomyces sp. NBC_01431 TaxID=2903863 RepID=UPI002E369B61|nr:acyl-CoA thioesterase [Streptomyces sp. NBC_01431]
MDTLTNGPAHKAPADSGGTLAHIMSEHDTNLYGTIHGGVIMKLIDDDDDDDDDDDAAAAAAGRHAGGPAVTVSVDRMTFLLPIHAGDLVSLRACVEYAGRTSMDVGVRAAAERWNASGPTTEVATARLTFVAIGENGSPRPYRSCARSRPRTTSAICTPCNAAPGARGKARPRAERGVGRGAGGPAPRPTFRGNSPDPAFRGNNR